MAPIFDYRAYSADGKNRKGIVEADTAKTARLKLKKQGLMVTAITEKTAAKPGGSGGSVPFFGGRVSGREVALMTRQLASLIKANIPLVESLTALVEQSENERLKVVLDQVRQDVNEGSTLSKAMSKHSKVFDHIFVNMVEAGESSGTLSLVLLRLADLKEAQMRLRSKIVSGMTYPALMLGVGVILMLVIFTFIIPKLAKVFEGSRKPLPASTKILMDLSGFIVDYWYLIVVALFFLISAFRRYINTPVGRVRWDAFRLRAPIFGDLNRLISVTRFSNTMGTLLGSGVPILSSMAIARNLVGNVLIERAIETARENITEGQSIAEPLRRSGEFPPLVIHMIAIGEKTGELPDMLRNISETYEEQVNTRIEGMTSLLEPIMIIGMGVMVGFIVLSIFIPLLEMSNIR